MTVQFCDFNASVAAFAFPSFVGAAGHAMKKLGDLDIAVFGVAVGLGVVAQAHPHREKSGGDFRWIDAPLCQRRPDVSRAFCGAQAGESECIDWTPGRAQKAAYAAQSAVHLLAACVLTEPLQCGCTIRPQLAAAVTFFHIAAVPPVVLDVLAAVQAVKTFTAPCGRWVLAGVNLASGECALALSNA